MGRDTRINAILGGEIKALSFANVVQMIFEKAVGLAESEDRIFHESAIRRAVIDVVSTVLTGYRAYLQSQGEHHYDGEDGWAHLSRTIPWFLQVLEFQNEAIEVLLGVADRNGVISYLTQKAAFFGVKVAVPETKKA